ncbi:MAG: hypothetical protein AAFO91_09445, partial [Bacteroidota bacterium]
MAQYQAAFSSTLNANNASLEARFGSIVDARLAKSIIKPDPDFSGEVVDLEPEPIDVVPDSDTPVPPVPPVEKVPASPAGRVPVPNPLPPPQPDAMLAPGALKGFKRFTLGAQNEADTWTSCVNGHFTPCGGFFVTKDGRSIDINSIEIDCDLDTVPSLSQAHWRFKTGAQHIKPPVFTKPALIQPTLVKETFTSLQVSLKGAFLEKQLSEGRVGFTIPSTNTPFVSSILSVSTDGLQEMLETKKALPCNEVKLVSPLLPSFPDSTCFPTLGDIFTMGHLPKDCGRRELEFSDFPPISTPSQKEEKATRTKLLDMITACTSAEAGIASLEQNTQNSIANVFKCVLKVLAGPLHSAHSDWILAKLACRQEVLASCDQDNLQVKDLLKSPLWGPTLFDPATVQTVLSRSKDHSKRTADFLGWQQPKAKRVKSSFQLGVGTP